VDLTTTVIAILGGFAAGCIKTLAGNGSAITLTILTEVIGLPGNVANGTNRIGIQFQGFASSYSFLNHKKGNIPHAWHLTLTAIIGAIAGVWLAVNITNEQFKAVFKYLLVALLFVTIINPKRWLHADSTNARLSPWLTIPSFLMLGFYGGFIQMGMGVLFLAITVLVMRINIIDANALKTFIITIYTILVILIFNYRGLIDWEVGFIIAIGQMTGGYLTAEFASRYPRADIVAYRLLILVILLAILSTFDVI
jgi:uncharacterized membrane protein YfcA